MVGGRRRGKCGKVSGLCVDGRGLERARAEGLGVRFGGKGLLNLGTGLWGSGSVCVRTPFGPKSETRKKKDTRRRIFKQLQFLQRSFQPERIERDGRSIGDCRRGWVGVASRSSSTWFEKVGESCFLTTTNKKEGVAERQQLSVLERGMVWGGAS